MRKETAIKYNSPMAQARRDRMKTVTRRPMEYQPAYLGIEKAVFELHPFSNTALKGTPAEGMGTYPDIKVWLWEDWAGNIVGEVGECPYGKSGDILIALEVLDDGTIVYDGDDKIVSVRAERLWDITEEDANKEGFIFGCDSVEWFQDMWDSIYGNTEYSWENNLFVWRLEFVKEGEKD